MVICIQILHLHWTYPNHLQLMKLLCRLFQWTWWRPFYKMNIPNAMNPYHTKHLIIIRLGISELSWQTPFIRMNIPKKSCFVKEIAYGIKYAESVHAGPYMLRRNIFQTSQEGKICQPMGSQIPLGGVLFADILDKSWTDEFIIPSFIHSINSLRLLDTCVMCSTNYSNLSQS